MKSGETAIRFCLSFPFPFSFLSPRRRYPSEAKFEKERMYILTKSYILKESVLEPMPAARRGSDDSRGAARNCAAGCEESLAFDQTQMVLLP